MDNRNERKQELDLDQMEQISGGIGGGNHPVICSKCKQVFQSADDYVKHIPACPGKPNPQPTVMP